ncbi:MAG: hypothetical protein JO023_29800, partial [Chloroflexi bacterium]|nr:hypothetical protein [Chloroflexota bacterium]
TFLSRLLLDDQVCSVIERYGDELATYLNQLRVNDRARAGRNGRHRDGPSVAASVFMAEDDALAQLRARVQAMEAQQAAVQSLLEGLQLKIRPLALALGSCTECFVGLDGCPRCAGQSRIGHNTPDVALLRALVVEPLAERGIPIALTSAQRSPRSRRSGASSTSRRRSPT